jgi:hypothetical protein
MDLVCNKCLQSKSELDFYKDKNRKCGFTRWCIECLKTQNTKWKKENKKEEELYMKEYRDTNKEKIKLKTKEYKENHKEELKIKEKEYLKNNKEKRKTIKRNYYHNVEKYDIQSIVKNRLRGRINKALNCINKSQKTLKLLGCDIKTFLDYLQAKFQQGMTWENYGFGWHLDHIIPCSHFDLSINEQQEKCFHYTNLQPMWAKDNCSKQDRWVG